MAKNKNKEKKIGLLLNGKFDIMLLIITILLLCVGLIILLSASAPTSLSESNGESSYKYVSKQALVAIIGFFGFTIPLSKIDYRMYRKLKWIIYVVCIVLLVAVGLTGLEEGGGKRWIKIFGFSFQPSEFAKVGFILFYASLLSDIKERGKSRNFVVGFLYPIVFLIPIIITILKLQNHFSATFIICAITLVQMFVVGSSIVSEFKWLLPMGVCGGGALAYIIKIATMPVTEAGENFRFTRIRTWLKLEEASLTDEAWQITQSLYAIGSGGLFGVGLGNSKQKYLYLPEPQNDFIFAVLAEELGFFGCALVILLFVLFVWRGIVISIKAQDNFGTLIGIGITVMIGLQALVNIAVVTNTIPVTGMPLPFFSYGGSAMLADLIAVGILLSVSRNAKQNNN